MRVSIGDVTGDDIARWKSIFERRELLSLREPSGEIVEYLAVQNLRIFSIGVIWMIEVDVDVVHMVRPMPIRPIFDRDPGDEA